jgi:hypothetical protein
LGGRKTKEVTDWLREHHGLTPFAVASENSGKSETGTTAGQLILIRSDWSPVETDPSVVQLAARGHGLGRRWVSAEIRLKAVTVLLIECYFVTGIGMRGENLELLHQLFLLIKTVGLPVILAADWQAEPHEVAGTGWLQQTGLQLVVPSGTLATCSAGKGRLLDYFAVTESLAPAASEPGYIPWHTDEAQVQSAVPWGPHGAVTLKLATRPRQVMAYRLKVPQALPLDKFDGTFGEHVVASLAGSRRCKRKTRAFRHEQSSS